VFFALSPRAYIVVLAVVWERRAMRRKIVVLFVAFASVFGGVACGGQVDVKEGEIKEGPQEEAEEAKEEMKEAREEEIEAKEEMKEAKEEMKEAEQAKEEQQE
jgi:uncharacterized protein (DUF3084 family)